MHITGILIDLGMNPSLVSFYFDIRELIKNVQNKKNGPKKF